MTISNSLLGSIYSLYQAGDFAQAAALCQQVLAAEPACAPAWHWRGLIALAQQDALAAVDFLRRAVQYDSASAEYQSNLGAALRAAGQTDEAAFSFERAIRLDPTHAGAHYNLGLARMQQGRAAEAITHYQRAVELKPDFAEAFNNLGNALKAQGDWPAAVAAYERAVALDPRAATSLSNLGSAYQALGKLPEALSVLQRAVLLRPDLAIAHYNLGNAWKAGGKLDQSIECYHRALALQPDYASAYNNLATALLSIGEQEEALACCRAAVAAAPDDPQLFSNYLATLQYAPQITAQKLLAAHVDYNRRFAQPMRAGWLAHPHRSKSVLRLGFISPSFFRHPVGYFLVTGLENLDRQAFEVVGYCDGGLQDDITARLKAVSTAWHEVSGWSDEKLDQQIRRDEIDILFDLAGHTGGNRLLVLARKPAPMQVTWLDYVGTTGVQGIDYLLADNYQVPPGMDGFYTEKILRMPRGYVCYEPPAEAPPVGPSPALHKSYVTFGRFCYPAKVTPQTVRLWARILKSVPQSRLILKYRGFDQPSAISRYQFLLANQGIAQERVEFRGESPHHELLATYNEVDIALDPLTYNGGLTTCEALWMGVPVVTCPGGTFAGRHSLSHLSNAGLAGTIASNPDDYVAIAVRLAQDLNRLAQVRTGLRSQVAASPLCDGAAFARDFGQLLRAAWYSMQ